jgi:intracellular septation protein A
MKNNDAESQRGSFNVSDEIKEWISIAVFVGGFLISCIALITVIESRWPSSTHVQFGRFGPMPRRAAIVFFLWLAIYIYIWSLFLKYLT